MKPTLVIMAAGMGRRYGGLKQIEPVGPAGELIIDYSVYDALRAGFGKVIFVINDEIESSFKDIAGRRIGDRVQAEYAFQRLADIPGGLPDGFAVPALRVKPWGTAHAVYACRDLIDGPFAVINADDFYGASAFAAVCGYLESGGACGVNSGACGVNSGSGGGSGGGAGGGPAENRQDRSALPLYRCCMAGYKIEDTMTENGYVARGVCSVSEDGFLTCVNERTHIEYRGCGSGGESCDGRSVPSEIAYADGCGNYVPIPRGTEVSMNFWGFPGGFISEFEPSFRRFLARGGADLVEGEFFLPSVVSEAIASGDATVKVLESGARWHGVTYREDAARIKCAIAALIGSGAYPRSLYS